MDTVANGMENVAVSEMMGTHGAMKVVLIVKHVKGVMVLARQAEVRRQVN